MMVFEYVGSLIQRICKFSSHLSSLFLIFHSLLFYNSVLIILNFFRYSRNGKIVKLQTRFYKFLPLHHLFEGEIWYPIISFISISASCLSSPFSSSLATAVVAAPAPAAHATPLFVQDFLF